MYVTIKQIIINANFWYYLKYYYFFTFMISNYRYNLYDCDKSGYQSNLNNLIMMPKQPRLYTND